MVYVVGMKSKNVLMFHVFTVCNFNVVYAVQD